MLVLVDATTEEWHLCEHVPPLPLSRVTHDWDDACRTLFANPPEKVRNNVATRDDGFRTRVAETVWICYYK